MAMWRSIGSVVTLAGGSAHHWQITYPPNGRDVGVVVAAPNLQELVANVELIAFDQGVFGRAVGEELSSETHYTVKIRNAGANGIRYNLNIGDWQPEGGQAPVAVRVRQLRPEVAQPPTTVLARRAKRKRSVGGARRRKAARRR